jgi:hypothetical protein
MTTGKVQKFEVRDFDLQIFCRESIAADNSSEGEGKERFFEPQTSNRKPLIFRWQLQVRPRSRTKL